MTTHHYLERAKERGNYKEENAVRLEKLARERGKTAIDMPSREREYMISKSYEDSTIIYYAGFLFVYCRDCCVTMYIAPVWFGKKTFYDGKKRIHDVRKYQRYTVFNAV